MDSSHGKRVPRKAAGNNISTSAGDSDRRPENPNPSDDALHCDERPPDIRRIPPRNTNVLLEASPKRAYSHHSDQESDCSSSESPLTRSYVQRPKTPSISRRLSVHRDFLIYRKLSRAGSEKKKVDQLASAKSVNLFSSFDGGHSSARQKSLHLGRSAPEISSYSFANEKLVQRKASTCKTGRNSLPQCQVSLRKTRPDVLKCNSKALMAPQIKNRRMSMSSVLSSDFSSFPSPSSAFSSGRSSQEALGPTSESLESDLIWDECSDTQRTETSPSSPSRPRAQSFTLRPPECDSKLIALNEFYRSCFPKAIAEMELKLVRFHEKCRFPDLHLSIKSDGSASFVLHQLVELATDCLEKSRAQQISSSYFAEFACSTQRLLDRARSKSVFQCSDIAAMVQELLMIVSRPARLLECLEFDPKEFYRKLGQEGTKRINDADVVTYILDRLRLDKHSETDAKNGNDSSDTSSNNSGKEITKTAHPSSKDSKSSMRDGNHNRTISAFHTPPQEVDFDTVKLISNGAYGAVLLVRHKQTRRLFAMKKLLKNDLVLRNMVEQVFAERDILTFIDNPFVVSFYCSFETKKHLCMVLEYVEGGDCGALLKNVGGPLPLDMSRLYFAETVLALEYLHNFGIVHRDLKPDNLLLTSTGHIKLTDFGLSKIGLMKMTTYLFENVSRDCNQFLDNQVFGTPEYIAPEVILRQGYGQPVDWWAMGVILYQFLVGCVPFTGDIMEEVFTEIVSGEILWPEEEEFKVCDEARDIIESLLERDPAQRLGYEGAPEVKDHFFFEDVDWNGLLRQKTQFVPQLAGEEDTSYFDMRSDRYCHNVEESGGDEGLESELFRSFSTCSPRYGKTECTPFDERFNGDDSKEKHPRTEDNFRSDPVDAGAEEEGGPLFSLPPLGSFEPPKQSLHSRTDNKSCSSLHDMDLPTGNQGGDSSPRGRKGLRATASLKRFARDAKIPKPVLLNNNSLAPNRGRISHRLTRQFSRESSGSSFDDSFCESLPKIVRVARGRGGFGFNFRALKVLNEATNKYSLQHVIVDVDKKGPAHKAGLSVGDILTHADGICITGLPHHQVVRILLRQQRSSLCRTQDVRPSPRGDGRASEDVGSNPAFDGSIRDGEVETAGESRRGDRNKIEIQTTAAPRAAVRSKSITKSRGLKLMMMNALRRHSKAEDGAKWRADDEVQNSSHVDRNDDERVAGSVLLCGSYSVELKVMPTVKIKKTIKLGKKISSLIYKKKTIEVLMMPRSFHNYQQKNLGWRSKQPLMSCPDCADAASGRYFDCSTSNSATSVHREPSHQFAQPSNVGRPSTLVWVKRRASAGGSMLSPLVLCPLTTRSLDGDKAPRQCARVEGRSLTFSKSSPHFYRVSSDSGQFEAEVSGPTSSADVDK